MLTMRFVRPSPPGTFNIGRPLSGSEAGFQIDAFLLALLANRIDAFRATANQRPSRKNQYENPPEPYVTK